MALVEINGASPATAAEAVWSLVQMWVAAGASVLADSDGSTYNASGGQVTSGATGAGGLGNANAWVRVRFHGGREVTFQRGAFSTQWRAKYSAKAYFTGGSPGVARTPSATDEALRIGGGTDASPTFTTLFPSDASFKLYGCADSSTGGWWCACMLISSGTQSGGMILDPLEEELPGDTEPTALVVVFPGSSFTSAVLGSTSAAATTSGTMAWKKYGLAGASYVAMPALPFGGWPNNAGQNPQTGNELLRPVEYERIASLGGNTGQKGTSTLVMWNASNRSAKELYLVGTAYRVCFGDVNLPFVSSVVN